MIKYLFKVLYPTLLLFRGIWASSWGWFSAKLYDLILVTARLGSLLGGGGIYMRALHRNRSHELPWQMDLERKWVDFISVNTDSHSQLGGALLPSFLQQNGFKFREETYIEAGACDGIINSNTKHLSDRGWAGILVEPASPWWPSLEKNRGRTASIFKNVLGSLDGDLVKLAIAPNLQLSSSTSSADGDLHSLSRESVQFEVRESITVKTLLNSVFGSSSYVGVFSLDIEGSEWSVLSAINFSEFQAGLLLVEHNYSGIDRKFEELLRPLGYCRILKPFSGQDSWYLGPDLIASKFV